MLPNRQPLSPNNSAASVLTKRTKSLRERIFGKSDEWTAVSSSDKSSPTPKHRSLAAGEMSSDEGSVPLIGTLSKKRNVLDIGQSNFAPFTQDHDELSANVLVFGNDSLLLGASNKEILGELAKQFDPKTDLVSLIGCSHGPSANPNGNEHLAIGRANRVKEELILANVAAENILDEGCWAGTAQDGLPARGVIVRVLRRTSDG